MVDEFQIQVSIDTSKAESDIDNFVNKKREITIDVDTNTSTTQKEVDTTIKNTQKQFKKNPVEVSFSTDESSITKLTKSAENIFRLFSGSNAIDFGIDKIRDAVSELKEMDTIITEISKVSDSTNSELQQLSQESFDIASKYGQFVNDYLTGVQEMNRSGYYGEQGNAMAELSILGQAAGDMSAEVSNAYLLATDAAYGYQGSIEKLNAVLDGQNMITNRNSVAMDDMAQATSKAASMAAQTGVEIDQLSAMIGTIEARTKSGGNQAGNSIKAILINLQNSSSDKIVNTLDAANASMTEFVNGAEKMRNPIEILKDLAATYNSLDESDPLKSEILTNIGGKYQANKLSALLTGWSDYEKMLIDYSEGEGSAMREAEKSAQSLEGRLNSLNNSFTELVSKFAQTDTLKGVVSGLNEIVSSCNDLQDVGAFVPTFLGAIMGLQNVFTGKGLESIDYSKENGFDIRGTFLGYDFSKASDFKQHLKEAETALDAWNKQQLKVKISAEDFGNQTILNSKSLRDYAEATVDGSASLDGYKASLEATGEYQQKFSTSLKSFALNAAAGFLIGAGIELGVATITKVMDETIRAEEKAVEKMNNSVANYTDAKSEVENINSELDDTSDKIDALNAKQNLSFTDKKELENLQAITKELENQKQIAEKNELNEGKKAVKDTLDAYNKQYKNDMGNVTKEKVDEYVRNATATGNNAILTAEEHNISALMAALEQFKKLKTEALDIGDEEEALRIQEDIIDGIDSQIWEEVSNLQSYKDTLSNLPQEALGDTGKELLLDIENTIDYVMKSLDSYTNTQNMIDNIFAKAKFDGVKDSLISAGRIGTDALNSLISSTPGLTDALNEAGVSAQELSEYIMALADPEALNFDNVRKILEDDFAPDIDGVGEHIKAMRQQIWGEFAKEKSDEEIGVFYKYVNNNGLDISDWGLDDLTVNFKRAMEDVQSIIDSEPPLTLSSLLSDDSDEGLPKKIDTFQSDISTIQSALDSLRNGEEVNRTDLLQEFPALIGQTNNLEEALTSLKEKNLGNVISDIFNAAKEKGLSASEMDNTKEFIQSLVNDSNISDIDLGNVKNAVSSALMYSTVDAIDRKMIQDTVNNLFDGITVELSIKPQIKDSQSILSQISAVESALSSQATGASIDVGTFNSEELADYQSALEYVNGTMQLNAEKVRELTKAKAEEQIATNDATKAQQQSEYLQNAKEIDTLRQKIEDNNFATGESADSIQAQIDGLLESNNAIVSQCSQLDLLNASLRESIGTYQAWKDAQNASESGDMFDDTLTAIQKIDDVLNNASSDMYGRVGRGDYKTSLDIIVPDSVDKEDEQAVNSYLDSIDSLFNHEDGKRTGLNIEEFCQQAMDKGLMVLDEESESYKVAGGKTMEDFAEGMNLAMPLVQAMFGEMEEFGGKFDWSDESVKSIGDLALEANQAAESLKGIEGNETLKINLDVSGFETKEEKISALDDTIQEMNDLKVKPDVDDSQIENANAVIQYCVSQKQLLNEPAVMSVDTSLVEGEVGNAISLLQQFQDAQNTLEMQAAIGMDTSEAQANVDALVQQIQGINPKVSAELDIDTTSADSITASLASLTPEVMVKAGIDDTAIIGYNPDDKNGTVKYGVDKSAVDSYSPGNKSAKVVYTPDTSQLPSELTPLRREVQYYKTGDVSVNGTAHVSGTANNSLSRVHNYGRACLNGDWGTKKSGTTLVGELGREIVVDPHTGRWYTVGDNGAEFVDIPKDSIVFNHVQTQSLLEQGYVAARGTALVSGTAMVRGGIKVSNAKKSSSATTPTSSSNPTDKVAKSADKAEKKAKSALDKILEKLAKLYDWIAVKIERLQEKIDLSTAKSENAVGYQNKNSYLNNAQSYTKQLIAANEAGAKRYEKQADKVAKQVGLSSKLKKKVQNGTIDIQSLSEDNKKRVEAYKEWYDKAQECKQAVEELKASQRELAQQKLDNIIDQYDALLSHIEHQANTINGFIDQAEIKGYVQSTKYYDALIQNSQESITKMQAERNALQQSLNDSVAFGIIPQGGTEWYEMQNQIYEVDEAIQDANTSILEFYDNIRQIKWDMFDRGQEAIDRLTDESEFLIKLMSNSDLFDDQGHTTDQGMATMGLHTMNYNVDMEKANEYRDEMLRISAELANDPNNTKLLERRNELLDLQQESILAAEEEKQALKDLVKEGIDKQLDALQDLIDKYTDALDAQKNLYDYQKNVSDQTKEIASLEKQLAAFGNDDSEEGRLRAQQTQNALEEARAKLEETEYDKYISDQEKLLDKLYSEYEDTLNERLNDVDQLITDLITVTNDNSKEILETLQEEGRDVGYTLTTEMQNLWGANGPVVSTYTQTFSNTMTGVQTTINGILENVKKMADAADKQAEKDVEKAKNPTKTVSSTGSSASSSSGTSKQSSSSGSKTNSKSKSTQGDGKIQVGDKVTFKSGKYYAASDGSGKSGNKNQGKTVYITKINSGSKYPYHISTGNKLGSGDLGWLKKSQISGYASGTKGVKDDEIARINEKGQEIMTLPDGSLIMPVQRGTGVINNPNTEKLLALADDYDTIQKIIDTVGYMGNMAQAKRAESLARSITSNVVNNNGGSSSFNGDVNINITLPNVMNYEEFANRFVHDNKMQRTLEDMIVAPLNGKSKFTKYRNRF